MDIEHFQAGARTWIAEHRRHAPADYGAICPPHLVDHAVDWQRRIHDAGYAGIHWPEQHGGQGLTIGHTAAWQFECASAGVPSAFNMVGGWGILMARTGAGAGKHDGISFFLFPMDLPGVEVRPLRQMTGEAEFDEVFLTDVELPAEHLLGPLHDGWGVGMTVLTNERGHIGTAVIGLERRLEQLATIADDDDQYNHDDVLGPSRRQQLAGLLARGQAYRAMALRQGPAASTTASLLKLAITEMMFDVAMLRGVLGGATSTVDGPGASGMLAAPGGRIAGGTSQIQRNIIGERLLGLPREPKPGPTAQ